MLSVSRLSLESVMSAKRLLSYLLPCLLMLAAGGAWAHGPRVVVGIGAPMYWDPFWGPWWYRPPAVYVPPPVVVQPPPPVYVEQAEAPQNYWYYCRSGKGYYPYVKECPDGWQKVLPQPEK